MRKNQAKKREVLPDPIYNSKLVTKVINMLMWDGHRGQAQNILYGAFELIEQKTIFPSIDGGDGFFWAVIKRNDWH